MSRNVQRNIHNKSLTVSSYFSTAALVCNSDMTECFGLTSLGFFDTMDGAMELS